MGGNTSKFTTKFGKVAKVGSITSLTKLMIANQRLNIKMVQNVHLIWLDNNIDDKDPDCCNTITQLRHAVNTINTFTDVEQCIQFLESMSGEKACIIMSGSLGECLMSRIHVMPQVDSIFIFCTNQEYHEQWAKGWSKIQGVYTDIVPICEALKQAARQCEQNTISMSFMPTNDTVSKKNLDQLDPSFILSQILKEIILKMQFDEKHFKQFLDYCRAVFADNETELKNVKKLEKKYVEETPIWWYTYEDFLYPMVNRALTFIEMDIIIKIGFFIADLYRHIEELHKEQFSNEQARRQIFTVYRGQSISKKDFDNITKTKGGLMSFNNFLFTSKNHELSLDCAYRSMTNPDLIGILFVMTIDPSKSITPFASINDARYYKDADDEILFAMPTVFRIHDIKSIDENDRLFQVELILTSNNDQDLHIVNDYLREETHREVEGWYRLGLVLRQINQSSKSEEVFEILLKQTTDESQKAPIYNQLGYVKDDQGKYEEAITFYEKAIQIYQKILPNQHVTLATCYYNLGTTYGRISAHTQALLYLEKALEIRQKSLPSNHLDLASTYNNIGVVYLKMNEYKKAIWHHEKALKIRQLTLPPNHRDVATSYNNIGAVYDTMGEYQNALSYYEMDLKIQKQLLSSNHLDLASCYSIIANVYFKMGEYSKALSYYEKDLEISLKLLPSNHPDLASSYKNLGATYTYTNEYSKALHFYEKALEICEQALPSKHSDLISSYNNIGSLYVRMNQHENALVYFEKALANQQESLPPDHSDLAKSYNNIGNVYENLKNYPKAHSSYVRAVNIGQQSIPPNHPDMLMYRKNLFRMKSKF